VLLGMTTAFHLAQFNVARLRAPLTDPSMSEFVAGLDTINALADTSTGFVWRLTEGPNGDATTVRPLDPDVIVTMSVWDSVESLRAFSYRSAHLDYLRRRRDWFLPHDFPASVVLWWIPAGHVPTVEEACARLEMVAAGPSPQAFTFRRTFPAPELTARR
jgi:heme-degrading monooxygenase HmoA